MDIFCCLAVHIGWWIAGYSLSCIPSQFCLLIWVLMTTNELQNIWVIQTSHDSSLFLKCMILLFSSTNEGFLYIFQAKPHSFLHAFAGFTIPTQLVFVITLLCVCVCVCVVTLTTWVRKAERRSSYRWVTRSILVWSLALSLLHPNNHPFFTGRKWVLKYLSWKPRHSSTIYYTTLGMKQGGKPNDSCRMDVVQKHSSLSAYLF